MKKLQTNTLLLLLLIPSLFERKLFYRFNFFIVHVLFVQNLSHLRFADDIVLISERIEDVMEKFEQLNVVTHQVGLKTKRNKPQVHKKPRH